MENTQEKVSFCTKIKIVLVTLLTLFIVLLIVQNWNDVPINLVFKTVSLPLPVIILISLLTGYIWGTIASYRSYKRKENKIRSAQNKTTEE